MRRQLLDIGEAVTWLVVLAIFGLPWWALVPLGVFFLGPFPLAWLLAWWHR